MTTDTQLREEDRQRVAADVEAFLRGGGTVEKLPGVGEDRPKRESPRRRYNKVPLNHRRMG